MIDPSTALLPLWMLLSAGFGFFLGELYGDVHRHRKCMEQANEDLRARVRPASSNDPGLARELKRLHGILHDIHKHVTAVTKGLSQRPL